jgi:hypothetical protein
MNLPHSCFIADSVASTAFHRYRSMNCSHSSPYSASQATAETVESLPHANAQFNSIDSKSHRRRGIILTEQGWQKLLQAGALYDEFGRRYTYEELGERSLLDPRTISRILSRKVKVDKRTLQTFFEAFNLQLEPVDYKIPSPPCINPDSNSRSKSPHPKPQEPLQHQQRCQVVIICFL